MASNLPGMTEVAAMPHAGAGVDMPQPSSLKVVQDTLSLRDRTTAVLRDAILTMRFKPGQRIVERQLCVETGVSRTCIRESMRQLEAEGLVRREHNKGIFVSSITPMEAAEIYEVRKILEPRMMEKMSGYIDPHFVQAMKTALRRAESRIMEPMNYVEAIGDLIKVLWSGYNNDTAKSLLTSIFDRISYIRIILSFSTSVEQKVETIRILENVIDAIDRRDISAAQEQYIHYLARAQDTVIQIIETNTVADTIWPAVG
ncbi:GntR family transcriptional regulator [Bosea sp. 47.2.35]|jgi:DNA-binding GntR family transcriptional regulator|uniref:GntR family transcriptional regulator n=1 Tax=Bosea sp. 47.2.35 TaxID=2969304 RepID=UPI0021501DE7|nr:GntR family transcriptional regulator [Bosea sp. 47.2.35]MCR4524607.1 GntR family transcriptional regulator [Bosea sp. 47.2.35]